MSVSTRPQPPRTTCTWSLIFFVGMGEGQMISGSVQAGCLVYTYEAAVPWEPQSR